METDNLDENLTILDNYKKKNEIRSSKIKKLFGKKCFYIKKTWGEYSIEFSD